MNKKTPEEVLAEGMAKFKAMGVTMSFTPARTAGDPAKRLFGVLAEAARDAGILEEKEVGE